MPISTFTGGLRAAIYDSMSEALPLLQIELLQDSLEPIEAEWSALWVRSPGATPFQHPRWMMAWWRHFGDGKSLSVLTLRDRGALVAVAPFCTIENEGPRKLMFLGVSLSDYLDVLIAPGYESTAARSLVAFLPRLGWHTADLQPLPAASPLLGISAPRELDRVVEVVDTVTSLDLSEFRGDPGITTHFAKRIAASRKRAAALGAVDYEMATRDSFEKAMDCLLRFHQARWQTSPAQASRESAFHREAASCMLERDALRLCSLRIAQQTAAVLYAFIHQRCAYFYLMAYDPGFSRISPGVLLMHHAMDCFLQEGAVRCEFLRGREAFKYRWNVVEQSTYALRLDRKP